MSLLKKCSLSDDTTAATIHKQILRASESGAYIVEFFVTGDDGGRCAARPRQRHRSQLPLHLTRLVGGLRALVARTGERVLIDQPSNQIESNGMSVSKSDCERWTKLRQQKRK